MNFDNLFSKMRKHEDKEEIQISFYIIKYCNDHQCIISNSKLNMLLYFINIEYMLKFDGKPLFQQEFRTWKDGPFLPFVYDFFWIGMVYPIGREIKVSSEKKEIIDSVLKKRIACEEFELSEETHIKNGPCYTVYNKYKDENGICKATIKHQDIYSFYKKPWNRFRYFLFLPKWKWKIKRSNLVMFIKYKMGIWG